MNGPWKSTVAIETVPVPVKQEHFKPGSTVHLSGVELRDNGVSQAGSGVAVAAFALWQYRARQAILHLCLADSAFSAEDVRRAAGEPPTPNAMGALFREAYRLGWIVPDGVTTASRPSRHASLLRMWRRS